MDSPFYTPSTELSPLLDIPDAPAMSSDLPLQEVAPTPTAPAAPAAAPAALVPPGLGVPQIDAPARPDTSRMQARYESEIAEAKRRQAALDAAEEKRFDRETEQLKAGYAKEQEADDKLLADYAAGHAAYKEEVAKLPGWKPEPIVKGEDYQNFSMMLMGLAMIFGTSFRGGWMESAGMMNGAMQGYLDGDLEKAQKNWDDFQRQYQLQMDKVKSAQKDMEDVIYADNLLLNAKHREVEKLSSLIGREDMKAAAQQRSIDKMMGFADASARAILTADTKYAAMTTSMKTAMARLKASYGATDLLTDGTKVAIAKLAEITGGKSDLVKATNSKFMRQSASDMANRMVEGIKQKNPNMSYEDIGKELAQNAVKYQGEMAAFRQSLQREAGVARLTIAVQTMEDKVIQAAVQYGLYDQRWMNMPMNAIANQLGGEKGAQFIKFRNLITGVARQYIEAITMPGSNAQLHASSQETADRMISSDMTLNQLIGAFDAFNAEISASGAALQVTVDRLLDGIGAPGVKSLISYQGSMFSAPMTEDQIEAKWNDPALRPFTAQ